MDKIDRQILAELARDGRVTRRDLAIRMSLSRESVARRLKALLSDSGARVVGLVHPSVLGEVVLAHVSLEISDPAETVAKHLSTDEAIPFVSLTLGAMALTAEIRVSTQDELFQALARVRDTPGVESAIVSLYDKLLIDVLPEAPAFNYSPDEIDLALIRSLRQDGRTSYSALAAAAGVSIGTARSRTLKLLKDGVVRIGVIGDSQPSAGQLRVGVGLRIRGSARDLAQALATLPQVSFLATAAGQFDLVATLENPSNAAAVSALDKLRTHPEVVHCETWVHLQVFKEQH